jgi:hypothetical protein
MGTSKQLSRFNSSLSTFTKSRIDISEESTKWRKILFAQICHYQKSEEVSKHPGCLIARFAMTMSAEEIIVILREILRVIRYYCLRQYRLTGIGRTKSIARHPVSTPEPRGVSSAFELNLDYAKPEAFVALQ